MITAIINAVVRKECLEEYLHLAKTLTRESRMRAGCVTYIINQSTDNPAEFVLFEQWQSQSDLNAHIEALLVLLGPPESGAVLPEKLLSMYESVEVKYYNAIEAGT